MAYLAYTIGGGAPHVKQYQIGEAMAQAGVPVEVETTANVAGILLAETDSAADVLGCTVDAQATRNTAQQTGNADPAVYVSVIINPDAVWAFRLSGAATSNTALSEFTIVTASATGLALTGTAFGTGYDDGLCWGYSGANAGYVRKMTAVDTNSTLIVALPFDTVAGDTFLGYTGGIGGTYGCELTTTLEQVNAISDLQGTDNFRGVEIWARDNTEEGTTNSFILVTVFDHLFASGGSV